MKNCSIKANLPGQCVVIELNHLYLNKGGTGLEGKERLQYCMDAGLSHTVLTTSDSLSDRSICHV